MSTVKIPLMASNHNLESNPDRYTLRAHRPPPPPPPSKSQQPTIRLEQTTIFPEPEIYPRLPETSMESADNLVKDHRSLISEFQRLFDHFDYEAIREEILNRHLVQCDFTTVLWRIFLHCLPRDSSQWDDMLDTTRRNYEKLVQQYTIDPYKITDDNHEAKHLNHPLSRDENSVWAQYFADEGLKETILIDVRRTCPDISYFRDPRVIDLQLRILFTHTRRHHPTTPYRQGMHEILGIIIYAIHTENSQIKEYPDANELMKKIYDPQYLEHDAYALFGNIMDHLRQFYALSTNHRVIHKPPSAHNTKQIPFQKLKDVHIPENETAKRMISIVERLEKCDRVLHCKLEELKIEPTVYGIRWLRVLFGREIPFEYIPTLWTVIFCFDEHFGFVDHFFIALLIEIGRIIGKQGAITPSHFLQSLMRQNIITNAEPVIRKALILTGRKLSIPPEDPVIPLNSNADRSRNNSGEDEREEKIQPKIQRVPLTRVLEPRLNRPIITQPQSQTNLPENQKDSRAHSSSSDTSPSQASKPSASYSRPDSDMDFLTGKTTLQQYNDNVQLQKCCAHYMNQFIDRLQKQINNLNLPNEDELHLPLSGLKQIAHVLDNKLTFDGNSLQAFVDYKCEKKPTETKHGDTNEQ